MASYIVNIDDNYVDSGSGVSASPYNFSQFNEMVRPDGSGALGDTFGLYGKRTLTGAYQFGANYAFQLDQSKSFVLSAAYVSASHWVMSVVDNNPIYQQYNPIISFAGGTIKDGIIYDESILGAGGEIQITKALDCWINANGNGKIGLVPGAFTYKKYDGDVAESNGSYIIGCTVYAGGGVTGYNSANIKIIDSFFHNFSAYDNNLSTCNTEAYHSCFTNSAASNPNFTDIFSQYLFTGIRTPYPLTESHVGYQKPYSWFLDTNNRREFVPFLGITVPPNPGFNYPTYPEYDKSIGGYGRSSYRSS